MLDEKINKIRLLAMDVDGTMTEGAICIGADGEMMKQFDVRDGLGISLLNRSGIITAIITGRDSQIVRKRAQELKIKEIMQGIARKDDAICKLAQRYDIALENIAYIGDDLNDLPALRLAGLSACPADAADMVRENCDVVLKKRGGCGAVRELAELILNGQGRMETVLADLYGLRQ